MLRFFMAPGNLQWDVRTSFAAAARAIGVTEDTVRARFQRLQGSGVVRRWDVFVNPALLGLTLGRVECDVPAARKSAAIEKVARVDGARVVFDYLPDGFAVACYVEPITGLARTGRLVEALVDAPVRTATLGAAPAGMAPTRDDWRLVQALRSDPRAPYAALAAALDVSERTVRRRHQRLIDGRAVFLSLDIAFERCEGILPTEVRVRFETPGAARALRALAAGWSDVVFLGFGDTEGVLSRMLGTPYEVTRTREEVAAVAGVRDVRVDVMQRRIALDEWLDGEVAKRAAAGTAERGLAES